MSNYNKIDNENSLQVIKEKIATVEDEGLSSTRRMVAIIAEAKETGAKTSEELVLQGEKLQNIERNLNDINQDLKETKKNISSMRSIFSRIKNKFTKSSNKKTKENNHKTVPVERPNFKFETQIHNVEYERITGSDREKEMHEDLNLISYGVAELKNMAKNMNFEFERQNPIVENLNSIVEDTDKKIKEQDAELKKIK